MTIAGVLILLALTAPRLSNDRARVAIDSREAEAVLAILDKKRSGDAVLPSDWDRLFAATGYERLAAREASVKAPFTPEAFRAFVESPELLGRAAVLRDALDRWTAVDVHAALARAMSYLPPEARIEAVVFPVIKPRSNSFVWGEPPAIFLAVDPSATPAQLQNKLAHELHHIGLASACPSAAEKAVRSRLSLTKQRAVGWLDAFGEGIAMLAAAGGPKVHPHEASRPDDRARWDSDMEATDRDLRLLDRYFRDVAEDRLTPEQAESRASDFYGVQGPWYTVGYRMAVTIERARGRAETIRCFCDARLLPRAYNRAANSLHLPGARWSPRLLRDLAPSQIADDPGGRNGR